MTVSSTINTVTVDGNDSATEFSFEPVIIFSQDDLVVTVIDADGTETDLTLGSGASNYFVTITGNSYPSVGYVTYPATGSTRLETGQSIRMRRNTSAVQLANLLNQGGYHPRTIELILDRITCVVQDQIERLDRTIRVTRTSDDVSTLLQVASTDAGKAIIVNEDGDGFELAEVVGSDGATGPAGPTGPQGPAGAGTGDMLAANNLSDVANAATARTNLGLAIGTNVQAYDATLDGLAAMTSAAANKIPKTTAANTYGELDFLDEDNFASDSATGVPSQQSTKAYIATQIAGVSRQTGEVVAYLGTVAPTGWVFLDGRTIGDASSGATNRANADTETLYTLIWNSFANSEAAVSSGRGANAAADFAAHKTIALPDARDRVIAGKGNMSGSSANRLTNQSGGVEGDTLGATGGAETHALTSGQNGPHTHTVGVSPNLSTGTTRAYGTSSSSGATTFNTSSSGSGTAHNNVQPTIILNYMVKL